jgi:hypothetical protein
LRPLPIRKSGDLHDPRSGALQEKHPAEELAKQDAACIVREFFGAVDGPAHEEARLAATLVRNHPREDVRNASILDLTAWAADRYVDPATFPQNGRLPTKNSAARKVA